MDEGLSGDERIVGSGRALVQGQSLGVAHGGPGAVVGVVASDFGDRAEAELHIAAAEPRRNGRARLVPRVEAEAFTETVVTGGGFKIEQDTRDFVSTDLGEGYSRLTLRKRRAQRGRPRPGRIGIRRCRGAGDEHRHPGSRYFSELSTVVMRDPVSPDISQAMTPSSPLVLSQATFCWMDQASSKVHHCPPLPV